MKRTLFIVLIAAVLAGCSTNIAGSFVQAPSAAPPQPVITQPPVDLPVEKHTAMPADPQSLPTLAPPTPTLSPVPTETPSLLPSPTATPHPMMIEAQRAAWNAGAYPGSDIVLEQELESGANYRRYYASYLSEGLKIYGLLTVPNGEMPPGGWPAIVFNHGYIPPDVYVTTERYIAYVDNLARSGYIVFRIDYRGHDRSEGEARGAYGDPGYTTDVLNAVSSIKRFPQANPDKIGMWGHSMGGFLTLRAMVISPDIKAGVIWAGVVGSYPDMAERWRRSRPGPTPTAPSFSRRWRQSWVEEYGTPDENPEFWASVSANTYVSDLSGPIQLHHGTADEDVPIFFSETLAQQVRAVGKTAELYLYPEDNHNIANYFNAAMGSTIAFYDQHLK